MISVTLGRISAKPRDDSDMHVFTCLMDELTHEVAPRKDLVFRSGHEACQ